MSESGDGKILLIDSDSDLLERLSAKFHAEGYTVATASDATRALQAIGADVPNLIITNVALRDMDGFSFYRQIRGRRRMEHTPVIFLSAIEDRTIRLEALEMGAIDFFTKPVDLQTLLLRVRNELSRKRLGPMRNPVTGLSEGRMVQERLEEMLQQEDWGIVIAGLRGLSGFRDRFGFLSADDVSRAVSLMITSEAYKAGSSDAFVGHTGRGDFIIVTSADRSQQLAERCLARLRPALEYFYPKVERGRLHQIPERERLTVTVTALSSRDNAATSVESVFAALESHAH